MNLVSMIAFMKTSLQLDLLNDKIAIQELDHEGAIICSAYGPKSIWYIGAQLDFLQCVWHFECHTKEL